MKAILLVSVLFLSTVAKADFTKITARLGVENAIVAQCKVNSVKVKDQIAVNESVIERSQSALSGIIKNVTEVNSRAQLQEDLSQAKSELRRLKMEPVSVTLLAVSINSQATLKLDVNCESAKVEATLRTFVDGSEVYHPRVDGLEISQNDTLNPIAHIKLSRMFVPADGNLIQTSNFVLSVDAENVLGLQAVGLSPDSVGLEDNAYFFEMSPSSRLYSLQTLIGIPAN